MPRLCTVCTHPQRREIDAALVEHRVSYRAIADEFGLAETSIKRHEEAHVTALLKEAKRMLDAEALAARMAELEGHVNDVLANSKRASDDRMRLMAVAQGRNNVETLARLAVLAAAEDQRAEAAEAAAVVVTEAAPATLAPLPAPKLREVLRILLDTGVAVEPDDAATARLPAYNLGGEAVSE